MMGFLNVLNWRNVASVSCACWAGVLGGQAVNVGGQNSGLTARNQSHGEVTAIDQLRDHPREDVETPRDLGMRNPRRVRPSCSRISGKREWLIQSPAEYNLNWRMKRPWRGRISPSREPQN